MKKVLLFSAAILALSSCSNTDVLEEGNIQQTNAIGFQTLVNKESRALTNASFGKFWVYGTYHKQGQDGNKVIVFDGVNVLKGNTEQGASTGWGYSGTRYWVDGATYNFYAYSCDNEPLTTYGRANLDETSKALNIAEFICDETHQHDLVFAKSTDIQGKATGNEPVKFSFKHILSKLNVTFVNEYPADYELTISNVRVSNVRNKGKFLGESGEWNKSDVVRYPEITSTPVVSLALKNATDGSITLKNTADVKESNGSTDWGYVIPFAYESNNVDIIFTLQVKNPLGDTIINKTIKGNWQPDWKPGYSYAYTVKLTGGESGLEPIVFGVNDWTEGDGWTAGSASTITFSPVAGN